MRIVNLIEDTLGMSGCAYAHGLSFYIETAGHRILMDLGPGRETLGNAAALGIDLRAVDTVVLSHGHYDHSGGIMPFAEINENAVIYMQESAKGAFYADDMPDGEAEKGVTDKDGTPTGQGSHGHAEEKTRYRYIGIDERIPGLPQVSMISGDFVIDDGIEVFTVKKRTHALPSTNRRLLVKKKTREQNGQDDAVDRVAGATYFTRDDFVHEQFLVVRENGKSVLLSGCAHNGILSILDAYKEKYGACPDAVISGFHLMKKSAYTVAETAEIRAIAEELKVYPTTFFTCHCTGMTAYEEMRAIMGEQLRYVHSGEAIEFR